ncbi:MAG: allulose-6-phosphate 3-epimerase [Lachnospiraceae bacterium]|nr:allulose-6-phosphate 3-epimerase [Lachnospiraceae bacterium]
MNPKFAPSLMGMDLMNVQEQIEGLNPNAAYYHVDIIDWHYAKNMCLSPQFIQQLRKITQVPIDVHLMVKDLDMALLDAVMDAGADIVSLPAEEIGQNVFSYLAHIKERGKKFGVVVAPSTPLSALQYYLDQVDLLTFMGVTPGFAKQKLIEPVLDKIREAHALREEKHYHYETQIDGGCHKATMKKVSETGVDIIIMGATCLFEHNHDMGKAWAKMVKDYEEWVNE